jgi:N4-gp56 family major capsid protein
MAVVTTTNIAPFNSYIHTTGLAVAEPKLLHSKFGTKISIPQKNSKTLKLRRFEQIAPTDGKSAATAKILVEGTVPTEVNPTTTDYTLTLSQYGNLMRWTEQTEWINEFTVDTEFMKRNSENMAQVLDQVNRDGMLTGTQFGRLTDSIGTIGAGARTTVTGLVNGPALDKATTVLEALDAKYFTGGVKASGNIGTSAVRPGYVCIIHPHVKLDAQKIPGYKSTSDYGSQEGLLDGEDGAYNNIRFVMSSRAKIFADTGGTPSGTRSTGASLNDVYPCLIIAKDAYVTVDIASTASIHYTPHTQLDSGANALGQIASLGWTAMAGSLITNDSWFYRLEVAASSI